MPCGRQRLAAQMGHAGDLADLTVLAVSDAEAVSSDRALGAGKLVGRFQADGTAIRRSSDDGATMYT